MQASDDNDDDDLSEFHGVFFDECDEHLTSMEALLLAIDAERPEPEQLNAIFRAAHSIKGGAAVFGFVDLVGLTHEMETVFDRVRKQVMPLTQELVGVFLEAGDMLKAIVAARRGQGTAPATDAIEQLCVHLRQFIAGPAAAASSQGPAVHESPSTVPHAEPPAPKPVEAASADRPAPVAAASAAQPPPAPAAKPAASPAAPAPVPPPSSGSASSNDASSIRVSVQKIDQLINLVGELVITQAMLAQTASQVDPVMHQKLLNGLGQLQRNTRDLQESAMSIRMLPISFVFSRFPRLVRDLAGQLGKRVDLVTEGEATELDKGLIERITDPLTHLVRNSLDHGIELPARREAAGKAATGTLTLRAYHRGGNIMIEVLDDGAGIDRDRIVTKARERGMTIADSASDAEVFALIFEPGFSTAEKVTDVSGRGVGMDVVKRNIRALGGSVDISSVKGAGSRISIRLPLTLAILDGMGVSVGGETFIVPLTNIVESLQPTAQQVRTVNGQATVVRVRGEYLPVVMLRKVFDIAGAVSSYEKGIMIVLEQDEQKIALFVDDLLGQHQVVIKSLETNYRKVAGVSGATIMGDGRVALILDVAALVSGARTSYVRAA